MKTIAILINKLRNGGAQKATVAMCNNLINDGYNIIIFMVKNEDIGFYIDKKIKIVIPDIILTNKTVYNYFNEQKRKFNIELLITPMHFDITYIRLLPEIEKTGIKTIVFEHASYLYPLLLGQDYTYFTEKLDIYKKISCLCCIGIKDFYFWSSLGVKNIVQVDNTIDDPGEIIQANINSKNILFVGRLQQDKNILFIIDNIKDILEKHKDWKMILVGSGNQENLIKKYIEKNCLQNQIIVEGYTDTPNDFYVNASIFVLASSNETFSYALYEAKRHGIPAIIPDMPFNRLITHTKGHITYQNNYEFKTAVEKLIEQDELRKILSEESTLSIKDTFTWKELGNKYIDIFNSVIEDKKNIFKISYPYNINCNQLHNIFNEIYCVLSLYLKKYPIKKDPAVQKEHSGYSREFDNNFPINSIRRKIAIITLYIIINSSKFINFLNKKIYKYSTYITDYYYNNLSTPKGVFCVDWNTMPELKNTIYDNIDGRKYYFQTGSGKNIDFKTYYIVKTSHLIITSSETQWLKNIHNGQKRMFINHACGAFKRTGKFMDKNYEHKYGNYDYLITSSKHITGIVSEAFETKFENIYPLGIPRTDRCFNAEYKKNTQDKFYTFYPNAIGKKIYIFAPTFRKNMSIYTNFFKLNFEEISSILKNEIILISLHPHVRSEIKKIGIKNVTNILFDQNNILLANENFSTFDLTVVADTIITDYSSVIFEAILMNKKVGFYSEDYEDYSRGFYFDYLHEGPSPVLTDTDSHIFIDYIRNLSTNSEDYLRFKEFHMANCDGKATERVLNLISKITKN